MRPDVAVAAAIAVDAKAMHAVAATSEAVARIAAVVQV